MEILRHPLLSLVPIGVLLGLGMLWVFGRVSNQRAIGKTKGRIRAHLYELRLFVDEPKLIWQAQVSLLRENVRYVGLMLLPAAVLTAPMLLLFVQLDAFYGLSPLQMGKAAIVTVQLTKPLEPADPSPVLELPKGIVAETPPVRVFEQKQISWRVRPAEPVSGALRVTVGGETATKSIAAGSGTTYLSRRRDDSIWQLLQFPGEKRLPGRAIAWIEVDYPAANVEWLGIRLHWLVWLLIVSMGAALLFRRRFRVLF
ncbi:MAG: hypothetical protein WD696_00035 [Bryobacteraceae bacterium]